MSETCAECGKPILDSEPSYYRKAPHADIGDMVHYACGDPFGIKAAVAAAYEDAAKIAEGMTQLQRQIVKTNVLTGKVGTPDPCSIASAIRARAKEGK